MTHASTAAEQIRIIGERTHTARRRLRPKVSQREMAKQLGWGANRISDVERATVALDITELYDLAAALDVTPEWLMGRTDVTVGQQDVGVDQPLSIGEGLLTPALAA